MFKFAKSNTQWFQAFNHWFSTVVDIPKNLSKEQPSSSKSGEVYLIGAGPGDADLITLKGWQILERSDVVLYDYLVAPELINRLPKTIERIFVGKKCGQHSMNQKEICQLLAQKALEGKTVARLKGGDPSIFGRASEELSHLNMLNIPVAVIPGITAASGCAAWSGLPLTHRNVARGVRFVTAHLTNDAEQLDWQNMAESTDTLVFYMGLQQISRIAQQLMSYGKVGETPIAIVDQGTTKDHQCYQSTLSNITNYLSEINLIGPALVMVGDALAYKHEISADLLNKTNINHKHSTFSSEFV